MKSPAVAQLPLPCSDRAECRLAEGRFRCLSAIGLPTFRTCRCHLTVSASEGIVLQKSFCVTKDNFFRP
jgi:hypothetical protein